MTQYTVHAVRPFFILHYTQWPWQTATPLFPPCHLQSLELFWTATCSHCTSLYDNALHFTIMHCTLQQCTALYNNALHFTTMHCTLQQCTALNNNALHFKTMHCTLQQCTAPHCPVLNRTTSYCTELLCSDGQYTRTAAYGRLFTALHCTRDGKCARRCITIFSLGVYLSSFGSMSALHCTKRNCSALYV